MFFFSFLFISYHRNECTDQCIKRRRDLENETREICKLFNDKDERIKILENEVKVKKEEDNIKLLNKFFLFSIEKIRIIIFYV